MYDKTTTETRKKNQGLSLFSFSLWHAVSLCLANAGDSVFILYFFLPDGYLKRVVANKLLSKWTKTEFSVLVTFSYGEVSTRVNPFATWFYKNTENVEK